MQAKLFVLFCVKSCDSVGSVRSARKEENFIVLGLLACTLHCMRIKAVLVCKNQLKPRYLTTELVIYVEQLGNSYDALYPHSSPIVPLSLNDQGTLRCIPSRWPSLQRHDLVICSLYSLGFLALLSHAFLSYCVSALQARIFGDHYQMSGESNSGGHGRAPR